MQNFNQNSLLGISSTTLTTAPVTANATRTPSISPGRPNSEGDGRGTRGPAPLRLACAGQSGGRRREPRHSVRRAGGRTAVGTRPRVTQDLPLPRQTRRGAGGLGHHTGTPVKGPQATEAADALESRPWRRSCSP